MILEHEFGPQRLISEGHVHDGGRVAFASHQIDQPPLGDEVDAMPIVPQGVLLHIGAHQPRWAVAQALDGGYADLDIEMPGVG